MDPTQSRAAVLMTRPIARRQIFGSSQRLKANLILVVVTVDQHDKLTRFLLRNVFQAAATADEYLSSYSHKALDTPLAAKSEDPFLLKIVNQ